jgi:DNA-binding response OmpR family regulator
LFGAKARLDRQPDVGVSQELPAVVRQYILVVVMGRCIIRGVVHALEEAGYLVHTAQEPSGALEDIKEADPLLMIVCGPAAGETYRALRTASSAPMLALLADGGPSGEVDVLNALEAGADDCQVVSIGVREVLQRVRVLLRRRAW